MTPEEFVEHPWAKGSTHNAYESSFLHMRPAPEYASGEVVLASTYRQVGFSRDTISEGRVPSAGREFQRNIDKGRKPQNEVTGTGIDAEAWRRLVTGTLRSPKQPNQTTKRFLQISPVVPDAALYSLSARLSSNSWNPGALVAKIVQLGEPSESDAQELWNLLFRSLSVDEDDDIWARFLQEEFESWRGRSAQGAWQKPSKLDRDQSVVAWHKAGTAIPATRFVADLLSILSLKKYLTRRQWTSMLEAVLRLGTASHVLWTCSVNIKCFELLRNSLQGEPVPSVADLRTAFGVANGFWRYGQFASGTIVDHATGFVKARVGINLLLHQLEDTFGIQNTQHCLSNLDSIGSLASWLTKIRSSFDGDKFRRNYQDVIESDQRLIAGKKGISSNVKEFIRHVLGKRQTAEPGLDSYDQGYLLAKRGSHRSARWVVALGPVSVLALVHACTCNARGPRTIEDFCRHLGEYGVEVESQEVAGSMLGQTLRNLGLVLDSPDAEGGMVVVNPFKSLVNAGVEP